MPFIFVHGVNNRIEDPGYKTRVLVTSQFLAQHFKGVRVNGKSLSTLEPRFPYWGDLASRFAWNMASLPTDGMNTLGAGVPDELRPLIAAISEETQDSAAVRQQPLLVLARKGLLKAVRALSEVLIRGSTDANAAQIASFVTSAQAYAEDNAAPPWLSNLVTDAQLLAELVKHVRPATGGGIEALGAFDFILNPISAAAAKIKGAVVAASETVLDRSGNLASTKILAWARKPLNVELGRFFGDIFIYLNSRGTREAPGPISKRILDDIDQAIAKGPAGEPLILMGHSLGGVILFDLLSYFRPDISVDLLITVGSQVSHFEEMKLYKSSVENLPSAQRPLAPRPPNIVHWINVFDQVDIFSYACSRVFEGVDDFEYDTETYTIKAHGAYFDQNRFYARLRIRMEEVLK